MNFRALILHDDMPDYRNLPRRLLDEHLVREQNRQAAAGDNDDIWLDATARLREINACLRERAA